MTYLLHLEGLTKQIYAVIFGFWLGSRKPVAVSYSVMRKITGATDPTISACLKRLLEQGLIESDPKPGMRTKYSIVFNYEIQKAYLNDSGKVVTSNGNKEPKRRKNTTKTSADSSSVNEEHKEIKKFKGRDSPPLSNLKTPTSYSVSPRINTITTNKTS